MTLGRGRLSLALALALIVAASAGCARPTGAPPGASPLPPLAAPPDPPIGGMPTPPDGPPNPDSTPPGAGDPTAPDEHADPDLEDRLPAEVAGVTLARRSLAATDLAGSAFEPALVELAIELGRPLDDITLALAVDPTGGLAAGISAVRVRGANPERLRQALIDVEASAAPAVVSQVTLAGRPVTSISQQFGDMTITRYFHAAGDTVYVLLAQDEAIAAQMLAGLP